MDSFQRFQEKQRRRATAMEHSNARFIFNGWNTTVINNGQIELEAAIVSKQESDKGYIYTHYQDTLEPGDIWMTDKLHYLIVEEIINIKDTDYHKYFAYLCNVDLGTTWGYFKSSLNIKNEQNTALESTQEPRLVLPDDYVTFEDKIVLQGRPWIVQEYDAISNPGLVIYSLKASTISKNEKQDRSSYIVHPDRVSPEIVTETIDIDETRRAIGHEVPVTLTTEGGYLKYTGNIKILKRSGTSVTFSIPFGVEETEISVKSNGEVVSYTYYAVN